MSDTSVHYLAGQYGRLSVEDGDDTESNSIGNQAKIADAFLAEYPDIQIVERYADNGYTGMNYNRPAFHQMMTDVRNGKINCIIIKDISRLGRHFVETSELVEQIFPAMNVRLISVNDNYDSLRRMPALPRPHHAAENGHERELRQGHFPQDLQQHPRTNAQRHLSAFIQQRPLRLSPETLLPRPMILMRKPPGRPAYLCPAFRVGVVSNAIAKQLNQEHIPSPAQLRYLRGMNSSAAYRDALCGAGRLSARSSAAMSISATAPMESIQKPFEREKEASAH